MLLNPIPIPTNKYYLVNQHTDELFKKNWNDIKKEKIDAKSQNKNGSFHRLKDRKKYEYLLDKGWDTPVRSLIGKALKY